MKHFDIVITHFLLALLPLLLVKNFYPYWWVSILIGFILQSIFAYLRILLSNKQEKIRRQIIRLELFQELSQVEK